MELTTVWWDKEDVTIKNTIQKYVLEKKSAKDSADLPPWRKMEQLQALFLKPPNIGLFRVRALLARQRFFAHSSIGLYTFSSLFLGR